MQIASLTETGTECNCSLCSRYGVIWGYFTKAQVVINAAEHDLHSYCHGDKSIDFYRCGHCGCVTHYTSTDTSRDRVAVNYRMFGTDVVKQLRIQLFDGADTWQVIDDGR